MLTDDFVATIRDAANRLRGRQKRAFQAQVAVDYLGGSARRAETVFGWGRENARVGQDDDLEGNSTRGASLGPCLRNGNPANQSSSQTVPAASVSK